MMNCGWNRLECRPTCHERYFSFKETQSAYKTCFISDERLRTENIRDSSENFFWIGSVQHTLRELVIKEKERNSTAHICVKLMFYLVIRYRMLVRFSLHINIENIEKQFLQQQNLSLLLGFHWFLPACWLRHVF